MCVFVCIFRTKYKKLHTLCWHVVCLNSKIPSLVFHRNKAQMPASIWQIIPYRVPLKSTKRHAFIQSGNDFTHFDS